MVSSQLKSLYAGLQTQWYRETWADCRAWEKKSPCHHPVCRLHLDELRDYDEATLRRGNQAAALQAMPCNTCTLHSTSTCWVHNDCWVVCTHVHTSRWVSKRDYTWCMKCQHQQLLLESCSSMQYHCGSIVTAALTAMPQQLQMQRHNVLICGTHPPLQSVCTVFHSACTVCTELCAQEHELPT